MRRFRLFTNDIGSNAFSCLKRVQAETASAAMQNCLLTGVIVLIIADTPNALDAYGPNGQTGLLPAEDILQHGRDNGDVAGPEAK